MRLFPIEETRELASIKSKLNTIKDRSASLRIGMGSAFFAATSNQDLKARDTYLGYCYESSRILKTLGTLGRKLQSLETSFPANESYLELCRLYDNLVGLHGALLMAARELPQDQGNEMKIESEIPEASETPLDEGDGYESDQSVTSNMSLS